MLGISNKGAWLGTILASTLDTHYLKNNTKMKGIINEKFRNHNNKQITGFIQR